MNRKIPVVLLIDKIKAIKNTLSEIFPTGLRYKAIINLVLNTSLRVDELINLKPGNIDLEEKVITLDHAKKNSFGNAVFNSEPVVSLIKRWLKVRPESQWLFCTITKEKKIADKGGITKPGNKLSRKFLTNMVKRYAKKQE